MASWRMVSCAAALRDRYQLCDIYDPLGSDATISGLCHRQRPNRLQHPQFSGVGMSGGIDNGGRSEPRGVGRAGAMAHGRAGRSAWASGRGKIMPRCVPRRSTMAKCSRNAFPGVRRWRDCALMRSWPGWQWQYTRAVRSRGSCRGKIPPRCVPGRQSVASFALHASRKRPRTGKSPVRGKIRAPCIRNELALAGYARHASEKPRKPPSEDTPREDLARKGRFSLYGPLESRMARESCHPASTKRPSARNPSAAEQHEPPTTTPPSAWQRTTHSIRGASGSHTANAPAPHRPATLRRQADVKSCAAHAPPQRQSATRGPTAP